MLKKLKRLTLNKMNKRTNEKHIQELKFQYTLIM